MQGPASGAIGRRKEGGPSPLRVNGGVEKGPLVHRGAIHQRKAADQPSASDVHWVARIGLRTELHQTLFADFPK